MKLLSVETSLFCPSPWRGEKCMDTNSSWISASKDGMLGFP